MHVYQAVQATGERGGEHKEQPQKRTNYESGNVTFDRNLLETPVRIGLDVYRLLTLKLAANVDTMREGLLKARSSGKSETESRGSRLND